MWPFTHRHWVFQPPPCICAEIEAHVRDACALRDEMATWATPLEEWKKLQEAQVQVLVPKGQPKPFVDVWGDTYDAVMHSTQISTATRIGVPMYLPMRKPWQRPRACCHCGSGDYHWTDGTDLYCNSCWSTRPSWR